MGSGIPGGGITKPGGGGTIGMIGMIGMIIPPEVTGPGRAVGSQMGPVGCVTRSISGLVDDIIEEAVIEALRDAERLFHEVLDVGIPNRVFDDPALDGMMEEEVRVVNVFETEPMLSHVEGRVTVPLIQLVFATGVDCEGMGPGELSQAQVITPQLGASQPTGLAPLPIAFLQKPGLLLASPPHLGS